LSGGGFRAALFHLGAIRRLNQLGILGQLATISSVSGGSILSAFLADRMVALKRPKLQFDDFEEDVAAPFRRFTSRDIRTIPLLLHLPWNWAFPSFRARHLGRSYRRHLTALQLGQLPDAPVFSFCATDMVFGVNWEFRRERSGSWQAGYTTDTASWPVAIAVAASSCFPPMFGPLRVRVPPGSFKEGGYRGSDRDRLRSQLALTDGGLYDNAGLEPVWKSHQTVLTSDGGAPFVFGVGAAPWRRIMRYIGLVMLQAVSLRRRMFQTGLHEGAYSGTAWSITQGTTAADAAICPGYSDDVVDGAIARIRTDLDRFTDAEQRILENHGYSRASAQLAAKVPHLLPHNPEPAVVPHPKLMDDDLVRRLLRGSAGRLNLRRFFHLESRA